MAPKLKFDKWDLGPSIIGALEGSDAVIRWLILKDSDAQYGIFSLFAAVNLCGSEPPPCMSFGLPLTLLQVPSGR